MRRGDSLAPSDRSWMMARREHSAQRARQFPSEPHPHGALIGVDATVTHADHIGTVTALFGTGTAIIQAWVSRFDGEWSIAHRGEHTEFTALLGTHPVPVRHRS